MLCESPDFDQGPGIKPCPSLRPESIESEPRTTCHDHVGGCQNYGPFVGTLNNRCHIIIGTQDRDHNFDNHPCVLPCEAMLPLDASVRLL